MRKLLSPCSNARRRINLKVMSRTAATINYMNLSCPERIVRLMSFSCISFDVILAADKKPGATPACFHFLAHYHLSNFVQGDENKSRYYGSFAEALVKLYLRVRPKFQSTSLAAQATAPKYTIDAPIGVDEDLRPNIAWAGCMEVDHSVYLPCLLPCSNAYDL